MVGTCTPEAKRNILAGYSCIQTHDDGPRSIRKLMTEEKKEDARVSRARRFWAVFGARKIH